MTNPIIGIKWQAGRISKGDPRAPVAFLIDFAIDPTGYAALPILRYLPILSIYPIWYIAILDFAVSLYILAIRSHQANLAISIVLSSLIILFRLVRLAIIRKLVSLRALESLPGLPSLIIPCSLVCIVILVILVSLVGQTNHHGVPNFNEILAQFRPPHFSFYEKSVKSARLGNWPKAKMRVPPIFTYSRTS